MAKSGIEGNLPVVWTFVIVDGEPFTITLPNNPPLIHQSNRTVWKLMGTKTLAAAAEEIIKSTGAIVTRYTEAQTEEQAQERRDIMAGGDPSIVPPK